MYYGAYDIIFCGVCGTSFHMKRLIARAGYCGIEFKDGISNTYVFGPFKYRFEIIREGEWSMGRNLA